jgi:hypothetical protein
MYLFIRLTIDVASGAKIKVGRNQSLIQHSNWTQLWQSNCPTTHFASPPMTMILPPSPPSVLCALDPFPPAVHIWIDYKRYQ